MVPGRVWPRLLRIGLRTGLRWGVATGDHGTAPHGVLGSPQEGVPVPGLPSLPAPVPGQRCSPPLCAAEPSAAAAAADEAGGSGVLPLPTAPK